MSPIYFKAGDSIFVDNNISQEKCPDKSSISISGVFVIAQGEALYDAMPTCDNDFFTNDLGEQGRGCCKAEDETTKCSDYTGNVNYDMGLKIVDPASETNTKYNVCLSLPFRERLPNFKNFIQLILQILIALIITAIIASCLEFWMKYGNICKHFYYISDCQRHNPSDRYYNESDAKSEYYQPNEISLIDFMFPKRLTFYPYPIPKGKSEEKAELKGGGKWHKAGVTEKCDKPYKSTSSAYKEKKECKPGFPYNLINIANKMPGLILKLPLKCFGLFFLFSIYLARKFLNFCYRNTSEFYKKYVENGTVRSNVFFFVLLWLGLLPVAISIFLGQIFISPIGFFYNLIVQYYVNRNPEEFINLFSKIDDFKQNFPTEDWLDGFDLKKMGSKNDDETKIADYYKIMNYDDFKNCFYIKKIIYYRHDENGDVERRIKWNFVRSLILIILLVFYIVYLFKPERRISDDRRAKTLDFFLKFAMIASILLIGLPFLWAIGCAVARPGVRKFFPSDSERGGTWEEILVNNIKNVLWFIRFFWTIPIQFINGIVVIFLLLICVILFGGLGNAFAGMWLLITKLIYFFFIPLSNFKRFLNIIKQHGNLLTIMLCLNVIIGSGIYLDKAVTSIMSLILAAIVLYKSYMHFNPK